MQECRPDGDQAACQERSLPMIWQCVSGGCLLWVRKGMANQEPGAGVGWTTDWGSGVGVGWATKRWSEADLVLADSGTDKTSAWTLTQGQGFKLRVIFTAVVIQITAEQVITNARNTLWQIETVETQGGDVKQVNGNKRSKHQVTQLADHVLLLPHRPPGTFRT